MSVKKILILQALFLVAISQPVVAESTFSNFNRVIESLQLEAYYKAKVTRKTPLKIAVLDNSFYGYEAEVGRSLPKQTFYHQGPVESPQTQDPHGLVMAQTLTAVMTSEGSYPKFAPELHLYETYGYSNFKAAIEDVVAKDIDLVLYSQVWEYGGNGDGRGFINQLVDLAVEKGVIWVNAAGNFAELTYKAPVRVGRDSWAELPGPNKAVRIRCQPQERNSTCPLRAVLSWNEFKDTIELGTNKDLDLVLSDDTLRILETAALKQTKGPTDQPGLSKYPREILQTQLNPGPYLLRVKVRSENFDERFDWLRMTFSGAGIELEDQPRRDINTLLPPADNAGVLTVGATDINATSHSRTLQKPEVMAPSRIRLSSGQTIAGTSTAAAVFAGFSGLVMTLNNDVNRSTLIRKWNEQGRPPINGERAPRTPFPGTPPVRRPIEGPGAPRPPSDCPEPAPMDMYPELQELINAGAVPVRTRQGYKIYCPFPPEELFRGHNIPPGASIVITPQGPRILRYGETRGLRPPVYLLIYKPDLCGRH